MTLQSLLYNINYNCCNCAKTAQGLCYYCVVLKETAVLVLQAKEEQLIEPGVQNNFRLTFKGRQVLRVLDELHPIEKYGSGYWTGPIIANPSHNTIIKKIDLY